MDRAQLNMMLESLSRRGLGPYTCAPPLHRWAWKLGIALPPPLFASFATNCLLFGTCFAVAWGGLMWLWCWSQRNTPWPVMLMAALLGGLSFGVGLALWYRQQARRHALPVWEHYDAQRRR
jgi:hypothetical protein